MKTQSNYQKVASYEAKIGEVKKVLLLYSGGLDTSVMLKWIQDTYHASVITLTADLGQQADDLEAIREKALKFGAKKAIVLDLKDAFADEFIAKGIKANASYQGAYHLSTPIGRAILAREAVKVANKIGADAIAHGCTGKGNDQVRIDGYILAHDPTMKIIAPVREWAMDRGEEIAYAKKHGIPVPVSANFPYSVDDNMWGMTWEGGEIADPSLIPKKKLFLTTYTLPENAPSKAHYLKLTFKNGIPVALNGKKMKLSKLISALNITAGKHGVGTVTLLEDRLIGLKNRGVYENPAAEVIITAHQNLEKYVSTRTLNELKENIDTKWAYLCYGALWYDPIMDALNAFNNAVNARVEGTVTVELFKGKANVVALTSPYALEYASFVNKEGYKLNQNASAGFIEIYTLQMKLANVKNRKNI
ncbi:MAG TPA: argininosuccinate synthase [Candidatus Paceibacterota bacterium]